MKNKKQLNKSSKKKYTMLGAGIGLAAILAAVPIISVVAATNRKSNVLQVTFNAGYDNAFKDGQKTSFILDKPTALNKIDAPALIKQDDFVGWAESKSFRNGKISYDKVLPGDKVIESVTNLTAVYSSQVTDVEAIKWVSVSFLPDAAGKAIITGNTKVKIVKGQRLNTINQPSVSSAAKGEVFNGWKTSLTDEHAISNDMIIEQDTNLYAWIAPACTITFSGVYPEAERIQGESDKVAVEKNTVFGNINAPTYKYVKGEGEAKTTYIFLGWYREDYEDKFSADPQKEAKIKEYLGDASNIVSNVLSINKDQTVYAGWTNKLDGVYFNKINLVQNTDSGQPTVKFYGPEEFGTLKSSKFQDFNLPSLAAWNSEKSIKDESWSLLKWQYNAGTSAAPNWKDCTQEMVFNTDTTLRPVMQTAVTAVTVKATEDTITVGKANKMTAVVSPKDKVVQTVTWKLYNWDSASGTKGEQITDKNIAEIDANGNLTVKDSTLDSIYVEATEQVTQPATSAKKGTKVLRVTTPIVESSDFMTAIGGKWYRLERLAGVDPIEVYDMTSGALYTTYARDKFNSPIFIGDKIENIPSKFLYGCTAFNSQINWVDGVEYHFGEDFMYGCTSFNQALPTIITTAISDNFLYGCTSFDQDVTIDGSSIGNNFLYKCSSFGASETNGGVLTINNVTKIGNHFLEGCANFNQDITFPSSLNEVGDRCMFECDNFQSTITVDCPVGGKFFCLSNPQNFSSSTETSTIGTQGFNVEGEYAADFAEAFPTLIGEAGVEKGCFRVNNYVEPTIDYIEIVSSEHRTSFNKGEAFDATGIAIEVHYQDDTSRTITDKSKLSFDPAEGTILDTVGTQMVTVTYNGNQVEYNISVVDPTPATGLSFEENGPGTCKVYLGSEFTTTEQMITIPSTGTGTCAEKTVTEIGDFTKLKELPNVTTVECPSTVTTISASAFKNITTLQKIKFKEQTPTTFESIGNEAFSGCTSLDEGLLAKSYGELAFADCTSLTTFTIPSSCYSIGVDCFANCTGLTNTETTGVGVTFGDITQQWSLSKEGEDPTAYTPYADNDDVTDEQEGSQIKGKLYNARNLVIYYSKYTWSIAVTPPVMDVLEYTDNGDNTCSVSGVQSGQSLTGQPIAIPSSPTTGKCKGKTVTKIAENCFNGEGLTGVTLPDTITTIGKNAFTDNKLTEVDLSACTSLKTIEVSAFENNTITSLKLPASLTKIGKNAFLNAFDFEADTEVKADFSVTKSTIWTVTPDSGTATTFDVYTDTEKNAKKLNYLSTDANEPGYADYAWTREEETSVEYVYDSTFTPNGAYVAKLKDGTTPNSVVIDSYYNDGEHDELPVLAIVADGFKGCTTLTSVEIPENLIKICAGAFDGCTSLASVTVTNSTKKTVWCNSTSNIYYGYDQNGATFASLLKNNLTEWAVDDNPLIFDVEQLAEGVAIKAASGITLSGSFEIPTEWQTSTVVEIAENGFSNLTSITGIEIPNTVTKINANAFNGCTNLKDVTFNGGSIWELTDSNEVSHGYYSYSSEVSKTSKRAATVLTDTTQCAYIWNLVGDNAKNVTWTETAIEKQREIQTAGLPAIGNGNQWFIWDDVENESGTLSQVVLTFSKQSGATGTMQDFSDGLDISIQKLGSAADMTLYSVDKSVTSDALTVTITAAEGQEIIVDSNWMIIFKQTATTGIIATLGTATLTFI